MAIVACPTNLCVLYAKHSWRQREGNQRRGEEHLQARDISLARLGLLGKWVGGIYAVAIRRACAIRSVHIALRADKARTDAQMAVVLVEGYEIHGCSVSLSAWFRISRGLGTIRVIARYSFRPPFAGGQAL
jgi:hypothetical protein